MGNLNGMVFHETRNCRYLCIGGYIYAAALTGPKAGFILDMNLSLVQFVMGMNNIVKSFEADCFEDIEKVA